MSFEEMFRQLDDQLRELNGIMNKPQVANSALALCLALIIEDQLLEKDIVGTLTNAISAAVPDAVSLDGSVF